MANTTDLPSYSNKQRWTIILNVLVSCVAATAIIVMVNYLAARHFRRLNWSANPRFQLSRVTTEVLASVTNKVKVVVFFDRTKPLYDFVTDLLNQYQNACPKLEVDYIDYMRSPGRAKSAEIEYSLASAEEGDRILFDSGGKRKVVYASELSEFDYNALLKGKEVKRTGFKGEQLFTSAIFSVLDPRPVKVYFLSGHNEHDPTDKDEQNGYLKFARVLLESQAQLAILPSTALISEDVPADCQLLIVANPLNPLNRSELDKIDKYLGHGGRLLVLMSFRSAPIVTGLEQLLGDWGVDVGRNYVLDRAQGRAGDLDQMVVTHFGNHPIVSSLARSRLLLIGPRSIDAKAKNQQGADAPKVTELATTGPEGAASLGSGRFLRQSETIPVIAAVEKGAIQGIAADRGITRIVVVGESYFLVNGMIDREANKDFARNAVNWLLNRDILVQGIGSRPIKEYQVTMTTTELTTVRWLFMVGFPGSVLFLGFLVWLRRRA